MFQFKNKIDSHERVTNMLSGRLLISALLLVSLLAFVTGDTAQAQSDDRFDYSDDWSLPSDTGSANRGSGSDDPSGTTRQDWEDFSWRRGSNGSSDSAPDPQESRQDDSIVSDDRQQDDDLPPRREQEDTGRDNSGPDISFDGIEEAGPSQPRRAADPSVSQSQDFYQDAPLRGRKGPPGRGPMGDFKWEKVDGGNQDGTSASREALAKQIFGTGVGFATQDLRDATRAELVDILMWLQDALKREKGYNQNLERTAKKIERKKKSLARMSLGELFKERVGGAFDHQKDTDDYRISMDFKRFLQDRAFGRDAEEGNIYRRLLFDMDHLIMTAGPAYKVDVSREDVSSVRKLTSLFERDLDKGAFQFPATYVMGLILDAKRLKRAISSKDYAGRPPRDDSGGKGSSGKGSGDDYFDDYRERDQWGRDRDQSSDLDFGGKGPRKGSSDENFGGKPRGPGSDQGGITKGQRELFGDIARAGTQVLDANDRYDRDMADIDREWEAGRPGKPTDSNVVTPEMERGIMAAVGDSDRGLDQIRALQRKVLDQITSWRRTRDPRARARIEANIRGMVYGRDPRQPAPNSVMGMLGNPRLKQALGFARRAEQTENPALRSAYSRIFGPGGKEDRVLRTQKDTISRFLTDRDRDRQQGRDPNNPQSPGSDNPLDPRFEDRNPQGPQSPTSPTSDDGRFNDRPNSNDLANNNGGDNPASALPGGGNQGGARDPNQRIAQIDQALTDPNLTPQERQALQAERDRLQQQIQQQQNQGNTNPAAPVTAAQQTVAGPRNRAEAETIARGKMPQVANSYGVNPMVLSDAELQAAANPIIMAEVAKWNEQLKDKGITVNQYMQYSGKGVTSTGKPPGDHFKLWIERVPAVKAAMIEAAQKAEAAKLAALTDAEMSKVPQQNAGSQNQPISQAAPPPSNDRAPTTGAITEPR